MAISKRRQQFLDLVKQTGEIPAEYYNEHPNGATEYRKFALLPGTRRMIKIYSTLGSFYNMETRDVLWVLNQADKKGWKSVVLVNDLGEGLSICMLNASEACTAYEIGYSGIYVCEANSY